MYLELFSFKPIVKMIILDLINNHIWTILNQVNKKDNPILNQNNHIWTILNQANKKG